jgi:hypothetical protein
MPQSRSELNVTIERIRMNTPTWVQQILTEFESRTEPHNEVQIPDALRRASDSHQDMSEADFKGYHTEWAAFLFRGRAKEDSVRGTHFSLFATMKRTDDTNFHSPDVADLNAELVSHWEDRARTFPRPRLLAYFKMQEHERPNPKAFRPQGGCNGGAWSKV